MTMAELWELAGRGMAADPASYYRWMDRMLRAVAATGPVYCGMKVEDGRDVQMTARVVDYHVVFELAPEPPADARDAREVPVPADIAAEVAPSWRDRPPLL